MPVKMRSTLAHFQPYRPSRVAGTPDRRPDRPDTVSLALNEGPYGPLPTVVEAITRAATAANRYPDIECTEVVEAIAARHRLDPARVRVGAGSFALFRHLCEMFVEPGDEVVFGTPSFEEYAAVPLMAGGAPVPVPLRDHTYDLDAVAAAITPRTKMVIVCNPNNPTGTAVGAEALRRFLDAVPANVAVVLDEAYCEFATGPDRPDGLRLATERDNLLVLRTFSKAYGLAGIRIGFCYSSAPVAAMLSRVITPFSVSVVAQAAVLALLEPATEAQVATRIAQL